MGKSKGKRPAPPEPSLSAQSPLVRPSKRVKRDPPPASSTTSDPPASAPVASTSASASSSAPVAVSRSPHLDPLPSISIDPSPAKLIPPAPTKRAFHPGTIRRLNAPHAHSGSTLSGAKIGGKSKDLKIVGPIEEEMWVTRKGLGFAGYLKKGVACFLAKGATSLDIYAMGAAIPLALSLALAIRDALPGGSPNEQGEEGSVKMTTRTGSMVVPDEITPQDEDEDLVYQVRHKSTVQVTLSLTVAISSERVRGSASFRGNRGRGRVRGRGRGRGGKAA